MGNFLELISPVFNRTRSDYFWRPKEQAMSFQKNGAKQPHSKTLSRLQRALEIPQGLGVRALGVAFLNGPVVIL